MRSDKELKRDVEQELEWEPSIDERRLAVSVVDGIVTVSGEVSSYAEKWKVERTIERLAGVRGIVNELEVRSPVEPSDSDIAEAAVKALKWNVMVPADRIKVKVTKGWLTLSGAVSWDYERRAAEQAVRNLPGVKGISNLITVVPAS